MSLYQGFHVDGVRYAGLAGPWAVGGAHLPYLVAVGGLQPKAALGRRRLSAAAVP